MTIESLKAIQALGETADKILRDRFLKESEENEEKLETETCPDCELPIDNCVCGEDTDPFNNEI